jgi:hypothetical protein
VFFIYDFAFSALVLFLQAKTTFAPSLASDKAVS